MSTAAELLGELHRVVDRLLALGATEIDPVDLTAVMAGVQRERDRLGIAAAAVVHAWEQSEVWRADGSLRCTWALARDINVCDETAGRERRRGRALARMPHVRRAIVAGRLSLDHLDVLIRVATVDRWELFVRDEADLVELCATRPLFDDARGVVHQWAIAADVELGRQPGCSKPSRLHTSRCAASGELRVSGLFGPVDGEIVARELDRLAEQIRHEDAAAGVRRTIAERRAVALVRMAIRSSDATGTGVVRRPLFQVIVGDETARWLCQLSSGALVEPGDLLPYVDDATMEAFLFDGPSIVIAKSKRRMFIGALRKAIQVRDRRCTHPSGCRIPAEDADVDHIVPASEGGATSQGNGRVRCPGHNRLPHLRSHPDDPPDRRRRPAAAGPEAEQERHRWRIIRITLDHDAA